MSVIFLNILVVYDVLLCDNNGDLQQMHVSKTIIFCILTSIYYIFGKKKYIFTNSYIKQLSQLLNWHESLFH